MDWLIDYTIENPLVIIGAALVLVFAVWLVIWLNYRQAAKDEKESDKFNRNLELVEKNLYKKCRHCGENVPKEDNICMSCGREP